MGRRKVAWGITGAGDYLLDSLEAMETLRDELDLAVTVLLSANGELVVKWYGLWERLNGAFGEVHTEKGANVPFLAGPLQLGRYAFLFISPGSANTVAKIAHGIADSLITNCVAQTVKGGTPVYIYPCDQALGSQETEGPRGERITIKTRQVDVDNTNRLREMSGIDVLGHPSEISALAKGAVDSQSA